MRVGVTGCCFRSRRLNAAQTPSLGHPSSPRASGVTVQDIGMTLDTQVHRSPVGFTPHHKWSKVAPPRQHEAGQAMREVKGVDHLPPPPGYRRESRRVRYRALVGLSAASFSTTARALSF